MIRSTKLPLLACFLVFVSLLQAADQKPFAEILAIKGVKKVEYLEPYLIIAIVKDQGFRIATDQIKSVIAKKAVPDMLAIGDKYKLRYYNVSDFNAHKKEYSDLHNATTAVDLQRIFKNSKFTTVYELDWSTSAVAREQIFYSKSGERNTRRAYEKNKQVAFGFIERLRRTKYRPEKLLCISTPNHGPLAYPVIDGKIKINRKSIPWTEFATVLNKKEFTPH